MPARHRWLMIGAGGMARNWVQRFLSPHRNRIEIVGLVDVDPQALQQSGDFLQLPANRRFTTMEAAFDTVQADCVGVCVPPAFHRKAIELAAQRGWHVLSEKPMAETWDDAVAIYRAAQRGNDGHSIKLQIMQNYRYTPRIQTLKRVLDSDRLGRINYIIARFAADYRQPLSWGAAFRHEMRHAILVEGSIHHFDQIRHLSGQDCQRIAGGSGTPALPADPPSKASASPSTPCSSPAAPTPSTKAPASPPAGRTPGTASTTVSNAKEAPSS